METVLKDVGKRSQGLSDLLALNAAEVVWRSGADETGDLTACTVGVVRSTPAYLTALAGGHLEGFFAEVAETYRDVFGGEPWNEYLACPQPGCPGTVGSGVAFALDPEERHPLWFLETARSERLAGLTCPLCGAGDLRLFYNKATLARRMGREFGKDVAAALLFDGHGGVVGFSYGWFTTYEQAWREKFALTFPTIAADQALQALGGMETVRRPDPKMPVFFFNEWAMLPAWRSGVTSMKVFQSVIECACQRMTELGLGDVDLLGTVMVDTNAHSVYMKLGGLPLDLPYAANVILLHTSLEKLRERLKERLARLDSLALRRAARRGQAAREARHG